MAAPKFDNATLGHGSLEELCPIPADKLSSTILVSTSTAKQIVFCLAAGQALTDHQTPNVATIHLLDGRATVRAFDKAYELKRGDFVVLPPRVTHSVHATEPTRFMLTLVKDSPQ